MGWTGDTSVVGMLAHRIESMSGVPARALARISEAIGAEIAQEFDAGRDPYGDPWVPLADATLAKGRTPPPLTDSGNMRNSVKTKPIGPSDLLITIAHPALPHQTGWSGKQGKGPARPLVPTQGMPASWGSAIDSAVRAEFERST